MKTTTYNGTENKVEILEISRPNPNPKNIEGIAIFNGWKVSFSIMEEPNGHLRPKWVIFPENLDWNKIIKVRSGNGHHYYANLAIIKEIKSQNLIA